MASPLVIVDVSSDDELEVDPIAGIIASGDGGVVVDLNPRRKEDKASGHGDNLALDMDPLELGKIADDILIGITADDQSRSEWLEARKKGIDLLGLRLEKPNTEASAEGMSVVRHPVLLEAVLRFQANARAELLPADGPVKVANANILPNAAPAQGEEMTPEDEQAELLEHGFNYYLTQVATEYYPDTNRMLFWTGLGGSGWKKVYSCPIRRRPVSESIDAKDIIVSNAATDLANAGRVTHQIEMRQSVMKRMQLLGVYRDVALGPPAVTTDAVKDKQEQVAGVATRQDRPEDQPHIVYECYCELDLDEFAPKQFKGEGIALPYRVTIEKDSRQVLEIRRNWKEGDESCLARKTFVKYPYVEGIGIYGIGLLHILGNPTTALTAAWRIMLDSGMFSNFPGFLADKTLLRGVNSPTLRVAPGGSATVNTGGVPISQLVMALPYKPLDAAYVQFIDGVGQISQRLGGTAEINVGEGKQDAPVGTTIALIEQATKIEAAVHKGLHAAQSEEFALLKELFQEDPEAFWRHNKKAAKDWDAARFLAALENADLTPVADPNTPGHMQRVMRAVAVKQLQAANPGLYDARKVDLRILKTINISEPEDLFAPPPPPGPPPPNPDLIAAEAKKMDAETRRIAELLKAATSDKEFELKWAELNAKDRQAVLSLAQALAVHEDAADTVDAAIAKHGKPVSRSQGGRVI